MSRKHRCAMAWMFAVVLFLSHGLVYAQEPESAAASAAPAEKPKIDLTYVDPDAAAVVIAFPRHVLTAPEWKILPVEVISAFGLKEIGIDPVQIEQVLFVVEPAPAGPPLAGFVMEMASPLGQGKLLAPLLAGTVEDKLDGKPYSRAKDPMESSIFRADDRTLLVGMDAMIRKLVANHAAPKEGPMSRLLKKTAEPSDAMAILLVGPPFPPRANRAANGIAPGGVLSAAGEEIGIDPAEVEQILA